jgi:site-specific recombinase XerD
VTADDLDRYREWLAGSYAWSTANRRLTVVRTLYGEALRRHLMAENPGDRLRSVRGRDDREGGALTRTEAKELLVRTERDLEKPSLRLIALRDMAMLAILIKPGAGQSLHQTQYGSPFAGRSSVDRQLEAVRRSNVAIGPA